MTKTCSKCSVLKPSEEFTKGQGWCKPCYNTWRRARNAEDPGCTARWAADYRARHPEKVKATVLKYREENRELMLKRTREWREKNKPHDAQRQRERNARRIKATPAWADPRYIAMFYEMAREATERTGILHHVDHIVPLRSKVVCGLHCEDNLQVLPAVDNWKKRNLHWPDMP
jgi:hypothetical protein